MVHLHHKIRDGFLMVLRFLGGNQTFGPADWTFAVELYQQIFRVMVCHFDFQTLIKTCGVLPETESRQKASQLVAFHTPILYPFDSQQ